MEMYSIDKLFSFFSRNTSNPPLAIRICGKINHLSPTVFGEMFYPERNRIRMHPASAGGKQRRGGSGGRASHVLPRRVAAGPAGWCMQDKPKPSVTGVSLFLHCWRARYLPTRDYGAAPRAPLRLRPRARLVQATCNGGV
jgi:hypothetical protein